MSETRNVLATYNHTSLPTKDNFQKGSGQQTEKLKRKAIREESFKTETKLQEKKLSSHGIAGILESK